VVDPGAFAAVGRVEEAQRRSRQCDGAQGGVVDVDEQSLGPGLLGGVHRVQRPHLPHGDAGLLQLRDQLVGAHLGEPPLHQVSDLGGVRCPLTVGRHTLLRRVEAQASAESLP